VAVAGTALVTVLTAYQIARPEKLPPPSENRVFEASRPAVALVGADFTIHTRIAVPVLTAAGSSLLTARAAAGGDLADALDSLLASPEGNLAPGPDRIPEDFFTGYFGTGFFITEDGGMITASHVVAPSDQDLLKDLDSQFDNPQRIQGVGGDLLQPITSARPGLRFDPAARAAIATWLPGYLRQNVSVGATESQIGVSQGKVTDYFYSRSDHAVVVRAEPAYPGRDVALLKVNVIGAVPALTLSSEDQPSFHEVADVVGYGPLPGASDLDPLLARFATGRVDDQEVRPDLTTFATEAEFRRGDSGGPVLDEGGKVIGMVSYSESGDNNVSLFGQNYFVPASVIRTTLSRAGIKTMAFGAGLTGGYYRALADADRARYRAAVPILESILSRSPEDLEARDRLQAAQAQIRAGKDRTPLSQGGTLAWGVVAVAGSLTLLVLAGLPVRRLRRRSPGQPPASPPPGWGSVSGG
jgi:S1-C subfamily serine protease